METTRYPRLKEELTRCTLPNGLPVYVVKKPGFRRKYAVFAARYGGMDVKFRRGGSWTETPAGIAHYLEHKMFDTETGNVLQELAQRGAEPNAFTSNAMTAYYFDCTEHFTENLKTLLSFVSVPYFTEESVEKERGIIAQEIRMIEDGPDWQVYKNLMRCLYPDSPVSIPVAGSEESIRAITAQTLYDLHDAFYRPDNMCLVAVGDVDASEVIAAAEETVTAAPGGTVERCYATGEAPSGGTVRRTMEVSRRQFLAGWRGPEPHPGPERLRLNLLGDMATELLMGESSPLYHRLYTEGLINGSFDWGFELLPGVACVFAGGESEEPETVAQAVLEEAERLAAQGVDESYFRRIHRSLFGTTLKGLNSLESIALGLVDGCFHGFDAFSVPEVFDTITPGDVTDFIRDHICRARTALSVVEPKEETEPCIS